MLPFPIIDNDELAKIIHIDDDGQYPHLKSVVVSGLYRVAGGGLALRRALDSIRLEVTRAIDDGARIIVLSDRNSDALYAPIPSLLLTSAVHHHLIREKKRTKVGLVVECGDAREVHHMALLVGYGAGAINPYLAFESIEDMIRPTTQRLNGLGGIDPHKAVKNYIKASRQGRAQGDVEDGRVAPWRATRARRSSRPSGSAASWSTSTSPARSAASVASGSTRSRRRSPSATPSPSRPTPSAAPTASSSSAASTSGAARAKYHLFNPETVFKLQHATRAKRYDIFKQYTAARSTTRRSGWRRCAGLFELRDGARPPVPIDEVEPVRDIVRRFSTGAMSYGSISAEAHETLAIAMNRIGAKSNTGEGGEDPERFLPMPNGDSKRSAIKQVACGRFGVTSEYLVNADDLQIKMAQGAKPGEGGQLPGHKVYPWIAKTRHSTPGVGLISPPPHHDIYSIEDLKQLIHDLKNANPLARVHVKLVAEVGVGTVAAGVSKAKADVVLISGHDGGTGASPLTSLKHAGAPWELGLAETQQTLLLNGLRDRIVVQTDGQLKTGRDVVVAALLGAEEFGFATAPLVVSGCVMMRVCHLDTCPVGVATQNPELRKRFSGKPEFVVNFFEFIAEEVRELMAAARLPHDRRDDRSRRAARHAGGDRPLEGPRPRHRPDPRRARQPLRRRRCTSRWRRTTASTVALDQQLIAACDRRIQDGEHSLARAADPQREPHRRHDARQRGHARLVGRAERACPTARSTSTSAARPVRASVPSCRRASRCASRATPTTTSARGCRVDASWSTPTAGPRFAPEENVIAGNVIAYGATAGEIFLRGVVGERFCVRNSGAPAVVEGVGDHGCEYMTGGRVVVLGPTGRNFGAGMSGGVAYVYDADDTLRRPGQLRHGRAGGARRRRSCVPCATSSSATATSPARRWRRACSTTGRRPSNASAR